MRGSQEKCKKNQQLVLGTVELRGQASTVLTVLLPSQNIHGGFKKGKPDITMQLEL